MADTNSSTATFCDSNNDQAACNATLYPPRLTFGVNKSVSSGFNWKLWGGVGVGVVLVVVVGVVFMNKKGASDEGDYITGDTGV